MRLTGTDVNTAGGHIVEHVGRPCAVAIPYLLLLLLIRNQHFHIQRVRSVCCVQYRRALTYARRSRETVFRYLLQNATRPPDASVALVVDFVRCAPG